MKAFKRELLRTTQSIKRKVGKSDKIVDNEYEVLKGECTGLENCLTQLSHHLTQFENSYRLMADSLKLVQKDLDDYEKTLSNSIERGKLTMPVQQNNWNPDQNLPRDNQILQQLRIMTEQIDQLVVAPLQNNIRQFLIKPVNEFITPMQPLQDMHKQFSNSELEFDYFREQVAYFDQTAHQKDPEKLPRLMHKMEQKQNQYQELGQHNKVLMKQTLKDAYSLFESVTTHTLGILQNYASNMVRILNAKDDSNGGMGPPPTQNQSRSPGTATITPTFRDEEKPNNANMGIKLKLNLDV
jgi:uncharacterized coiled-coil protein SlyX